MATPNVDKMLKTMQQNNALMAELSLALARIEGAAGVNLTDDEKKEFFKELADLMSREVLVIWF